MTGPDPDQLRRTVVRAVLPRLGDYATLTTAEIAREAGVGESDLLAVFADKDAVMTACAAALTEAMTALLDPAGEVRRITAIPPDQPLATRLVQVIDILDAYHRRIRVELDDLLPDLAGPQEPGTRASLPQTRSFGESPEVRRAVATLLEPDARRLRLPAAVLAAVFLGLIAGSDEPRVPADRVVDLFLHGALST
jgi:AcrR family transcriptional regulator